MPAAALHANRAAKQKAYRQRTEAARRAALEAKGLPTAPTIPTMPGTARWKALHEQAAAAVAGIRDEMQAYFDDRSEAWQEDERGDEFSAKIEAVGEIADALADLEL